MMPTNTRSDVAPVPTQATGQPPENPAPRQPIVPQMYTQDVPDDPRGAKRRREEESPESSEPSLKRARVEPSHDNSSDDDSPDESVDTELSALHSAVWKGDAGKIKELIEQSPRVRDVVIPGEDGATLLCRAASAGRADIVRILVSAGCPINVPSRRDGLTPLMHASEQGDVKMIVQLCRLGADPLVTHKALGWDALNFAVKTKNLDACKTLIEHGANLLRLLSIPDNIGAKPFLSTPVCLAIVCDFVELIDWWLDHTKQAADVLEPSTNTSLWNVAITKGALSVIRSLLKRGAHLANSGLVTPDNKYLVGAVEIATYYKQWAVVEYLLGMGFLANVPSVRKSDLCIRLGWGVATDMHIHLTTQIDANTRADRLTDEQLWLHPERAITRLARTSLATSNALQQFSVAYWHDQGLLGTILCTKDFTDLPAGSALLLGRKNSYGESFFLSRQSLEAQQTQMLVEILSDRLCSPEWPQRFSGLNLTPKGELVMNQIAIAQGELILKGIAILRARFDRQVASLPDLCMNIYISRTHRLNEADLTKRITGEWGLYEPIARAVIRLVKVAYEKLCTLKPERVTAEFAALPLAEQFRHSIVDTLEEWDKIPEIVETFVKCESSALDVVSNLLLQQWRLFCEAFGVTKPRFSPFGPHQLGASQPELDVHVEPVMEVDEAPVVAASTRATASYSQ